MNHGDQLNYDYSRSLRMNHDDQLNYDNTPGALDEPWWPVKLWQYSSNLQQPWNNHDDNDNIPGALVWTVVTS